MKEEIYKICTKLNDGQIAVVEATEQLLLLFSVSGRSAQSNCVHCHEHILTVKTLKYKCKHCGDEKWEQLD